MPSFSLGTIKLNVIIRPASKYKIRDPDASIDKEMIPMKAYNLLVSIVILLVVLDIVIFAVLIFWYCLTDRKRRQKRRVEELPGDGN